jgi:hypothetical protein
MNKEQVMELLELKDEYIQLLTDELTELVSSAYVHGFRSTRVEAGESLRQKIKALEKIINAPAPALPQPATKPKVVCFCGSTRFAEWFMIKRWELEKQGIITFGINILPDGYFEGEGHHGAEQEGVKHILDELHKRKIDLSDEVFILNVGGYIGESTRNELEYAKSIGKPVFYLEPEPQPDPEKYTIRDAHDQLDFDGTSYQDAIQSPQPTVTKGRCCGRCDGVNDICVADMVCDLHNVRGCEICYGLITQPTGEEEDCVTSDNNSSSDIGDAPFKDSNSIAQIYYALDAKHPVLNGRGKDIRRIYFVKCEVGGREYTIGVVACDLLGTYKTFEEILGKPEPPIVAIWSEPISENQQSPIKY